MRDWISLTKLSDDELAKIDIAEMNLACAVGLNGGVSLGASKCLSLGIAQPQRNDSKYASS